MVIWPPGQPSDPALDPFGCRGCYKLDQTICLQPSASERARTKLRSCHSAACTSPGQTARGINLSKWGRNAARFLYRRAQRLRHVAILPSRSFANNQHAARRIDGDDGVTGSPPAAPTSRGWLRTITRSTALRDTSPTTPHQIRSGRWSQQHYCACRAAARAVSRPTGPVEPARRARAVAAQPSHRPHTPCAQSLVQRYRYCTQPI